jgi:hypothetical protein
MGTRAVYLAFWLALMALAIGNGLLREFGFGKSLPELYSHQLSTATGLLITTGAVWLLAYYWRPPASAGQAIAIGVAWLAFTLAFEFIFGRYVAGHSWQRLLYDYNLSAGRVWPVFLAWILLLPYAVFKFLE